ncbi:hypothetical protein OKA04_22530, partial [Luteolibacter flavescens]
IGVGYPTPTIAQLQEPTDGAADHAYAGASLRAIRMGEASDWFSPTGFNLKLPFTVALLREGRFGGF